VTATIGIEATDTLRLSEALTIEMYEEGRLVQCHHIESPQPSASEEVPTTIRTIYRFADWSGREDVIALCRSYLDELGSIVVDGQARGFLT
jgi:hypothetical protein